MELKAGDIVMLKSGGQPLTVAEVKGEDVLCVWMGMEGDLFRETLPLATLIQVEEDEDDEEEDDEDDE
ncbi:YodC family protein [Bradyrhizobium sp. CCBAU 53338]|uniref:YodC family protein n=1 Tax=Bradyrhizobium sp. CCBAU 53338 TaxID=1325111 RepID=UPI00188C7875|nr:DUF2158 domain-containing protein [Bradyrhizobium sp. CCBAU 53338]QOZ54655.1 DUF2158 domain-containing protein [Bradyrhizobium sp. CCBAU 53338]